MEGEGVGTKKISKLEVFIVLERSVNRKFCLDGWKMSFGLS